MHTTTITDVQWAMICHELSSVVRMEVRNLWGIGGHHPQLGDLIVVEAAIGGALLYTLISERPLSVLFWPEAA